MEMGWCFSPLIWELRTKGPSHKIWGYPFRRKNKWLYQKDKANLCNSPSGSFSYWVHASKRSIHGHENKGHGRTRWVMWRLKILHDRVEWRSRYIGPPPAPVSYVLAYALIFVGPSCKQQCCLVHCYSVCRAYTLPETYQKFGALWIECFLILITVLSWLGCISLASEVCGHNPEGPQTRVLWPLDTEVEQPLKRLTGALFKEETWVVLIHCKAICIGMLVEWTSGRHINYSYCIWWWIKYIFEIKLCFVLTLWKAPCRNDFFVHMHYPFSPVIHV